MSDYTKHNMVKSSKAVKAIYTKGSSLVLELNGGNWYEYPNQAQHAEPLATAPSAGKYFNVHILGLRFVDTRNPETLAV